MAEPVSGDEINSVAFFVRGEITVGVIDEWIPSLNLLGHAQVSELDIGSRCGGHGICGGDRIRIAAEIQSRFLSAPTEHELELLDEDERRAGWRLACQCFPDAKRFPGQIRIELPPDRT